MEEFVGDKIVDEELCVDIDGEEDEEEEGDEDEMDDVDFDFVADIDFRTCWRGFENIIFKPDLSCMIPFSLVSDGCAGSCDLSKTALLSIIIFLVDGNWLLFNDCCDEDEAILLFNFVDDEAILDDFSESIVD